MAILCLFLPVWSFGALRSESNPGKPGLAWNPHPDQDDIVLPMPNGLQMVFRLVVLPSSGALYDKKFTMGIGDTGEERSLYERTLMPM